MELLKDPEYQAKIEEITERLEAERMTHLHMYECPGCLFYQKCALLEEVEDDEEMLNKFINSTGTECKLKERLQDMTDAEVGEYYLMRHWEE